MGRVSIACRTLALISTSLACESVEPVLTTLSVVVSGCAEIHADGRCELDPATRELRIWTAHDLESAPLEVSADGARLPRQSTQQSSGQLAVVRVPRGTRELQVRVTPRDGPTSFARVSVRETERSPDADRLVEEQRTAGPVAAEVLDAKLGRLSRTAQAQALDGIGRNELARGHIERAVSALTRAEGLHQSLGHLLGELRATFALTYIDIVKLRRFGHARSRLRNAAERAAEQPDAQLELLYYEGLLAREIGDVRAAFQAVERAEALARQLGHAQQHALTQRTRALLLDKIGRPDVARAILSSARRELPATMPACQRASVITNAGWVALRDAEQRHDQTSEHDAVAEQEAESAFVEAIALHEKACPSRSSLQNLWSNVARLALLRHQFPAVQRILEQHGTASVDPRSAPTWADIRGRLALESKKAELALQHFDHEAELGAARPDVAWRAQFGRARALEQLGDPLQALAAYAECETWLDVRSARVPLTDGRESLVHANTRSTAHYVALLLRLGREERAYGVARAARVRVLRQLHSPERIAGLPPAARAAWDDAIGEYHAQREHVDVRSADEWRLAASRMPHEERERQGEQRALDAALDRAFALLDEQRVHAVPAGLPSAGELVVLAHPLPSGHVLFVVDSDGVATEYLRSQPTEEALAAALLTALEGRLERATRLRVLAYGAFKKLDVHALIWRGRPLIASLPVVYGVDVAASDAESSPGRLNAPVIVADTHDDLSEARAEAGFVAERLAQHFPAPPRILRSTEATRTEVTRALDSSSFVHFAGHARHEKLGWGSALLLADGQSVTAADLVTLPIAPRAVVLAGCETAADDPEIDPATLSLSNAFVLAGTEVVVASSRPVDDALVHRLMMSMYADETFATDLAAALARAQAQLAELEPGSDWASLRAIVR